MDILIRSDKNVEVDEALERYLREEVADAFERFRGRLTTVEVHLGDENADRPGETDMRCMIEARPSGRQPVAVTHHAATLPEAVSGAAHKMKRLLERTFDRAESLRGRDSIRHPDAS